MNGEALEPSSGSQRELVSGDGTRLLLHEWRPSAATRIGAVVFYVHGIQSHAGWVAETGAVLARSGVATAVLDRRGSGRSGGARGDLPSAQHLLDDYGLALSVVAAEYPGVRLTVLGQSFGGSVLAALAVSGMSLADQLIYCAPALGQQRRRHPTTRLSELRGMTGLESGALALRDEDYTAVNRYLDFMANDMRMLRRVTRNTRATMVQLEDMYTDARSLFAGPVHLAVPHRDEIVDPEAAESALGALHPHFERRNFPTDNHYLEFSSLRSEYWSWLAEIAL